jgi:glucose-6-phosphate 1-dehydrogenase
MKWLNNLEFEIEWRLREIFDEHVLMSVDHPRVKTLIQNLASVRRAKELHYERDRHRLSA